MSRHSPYSGPPPIRTLSDTWRTVREGIDKIYKLQSMNRMQYMLLYSDIYSYCTSVEPAKSSATGGSGRKNKTESRNSRDPSSGAKFVGDELYKKLKEDLKSRVMDYKKAAEGKTGNELLEFFYTNWSRFKTSSVTVNGIFGYLNRNWVKRECDEGRKNIFYVYQLALNMWKEHWLKPHQLMIIPALMSEIERERRGENILQSAYLKVIIDCYVELGFESEDSTLSSGAKNKYPGQRSNTEHLHVYEDMFEIKFLEETEKFYRIESRDFLQHNSVPAYLVKAERRLEEERKRCSDYIHKNTEQKLLDKCLEALLANHLSVFWQEFTVLLDNDKDQDLGRMFRLCSLIVNHKDPNNEGEAINGLDRLVDLFEHYVAERGLEAIRSVAQSVVTPASASAGSQDSKLYVDTILSVHRKYYNLVLQSFNNNHRFVEALDKACVKFINKNELTKVAKSNQKTPELLAKYADALLKKGSKDNVVGDELEDTLTQVMTVFKYVEDKDVFQKFYSRHLSRRLVFNHSVSEDVESSMISKLKENCGFEYTTKLQRMFHDIGASRDLNAQFQDFVKREALNLGIDFEIKVLSSNAWPIGQGSRVTIPSELERCYTAFDKFYKKTHEGRKLQYSYNNCRGELVTHFSKSRYTLQVSTYQIAVLLMYNTENSYTVQEIADTTNLEMNVLVQVLAILVKAKLLIREDGADSGEMQPASRMRLNLEFKNKRLRINLNSQLKSESKQEQEQTSKLVEEDRSYIIQACVVRIMKTRKEMKHQNLVSDVITQLTQFKPNIHQIKKNIDILIEKEYLQRKTGEIDKYEYLA